VTLRPLPLWLPRREAGAAPTPAQRRAWPSTVAGVLCLLGAPSPRARAGPPPPAITDTSAAGPPPPACSAGELVVHHRCARTRVQRRRHARRHNRSRGNYCGRICTHDPGPVSLHACPQRFGESRFSASEPVISCPLAACSMPTRDTSFELHRPEAGAATSDVRAGVLDVMLGHLQLTCV